MPLFNVEVVMSTAMVVQADDADHAYDVAVSHARDAFSDASATPSAQVTGEVSSVSQLRSGWDGACLPYGGDGNTRLIEMLKP